MTSIHSKIKLIGGQVRNDINRLLESIQDLYAFPAENTLRERIQLTNRKKLVRMDLEYLRSLATSSPGAYPLTHTPGGTGSFPTSNLKYGGGLETDGTYYQTISSHASLGSSGADGLSMALWIYPNNEVDPTYFVDSASGFWVVVNGTTCQVLNQHNNDFYNLIIIPNTWNHIAVAYKVSNGAMDVYLNNTKYSTSGVTGDISAGAFYLMRSSGGSSQPSSGSRIAHFTIVKKYVDSTWVDNHYKGIVDFSGSNTPTTYVPFVINDSPVWDDDTP